MDVEIGRDTLVALAAVAWADGNLDPSEAAGIRSAASGKMELVHTPTWCIG